MLKKFLSGSGIFALSVLAFSIVRQIIVFPAISHGNDELFAGLTFMVFTFEAIAYGLTGAIPDYYVRRVHGNTVDAYLIRRLGRLCLLSFVGLPVFMMLGMSLAVSLLLTLYLHLFALNALKIKIVFNRLHFFENFVYMAFRSMPYLLVLWGIKGKFEWIKGQEYVYTAALLLAFEFLYWLRLSTITRKDMAQDVPGNESSGRQEALLAAILPFMVSALLMGFIQRGDMTLIKLLNDNYYVGYAKLILTVNFFCAPLSLMVASPLLSFMSRYGLRLSSYEMRRILVVVAGFVLLTGIGAVLVFGWISRILYHVDYDGSMWVVFYFTVTTLIYAVVRTLVVKYANIHAALAANILVVMITLAVAAFVPVEWVPITFFASRIVFLFFSLLVR